MPYKDIEKFRAYQREYKRKKYWENPESARDKAREYRRLHPEVRKRQRKRRRTRAKQVWGCGQCKSNAERMKVGNKAEKFAEEVLLPHLGFTNILRIGGYRSKIPL